MPDSPADQSLIERLRAAYDGAYWRAQGFEVTEAEPGRAVVRLPVQEHHLNTQGVAHGGVIAALVDTAVGCAVRGLRSEDEVRVQPNMTSDLHVSYLAAANGAELFAEARVTKPGRTLNFVEVDVRDEDGRKVARAIVTCVVASRPAKAREGLTPAGS